MARKAVIGSHLRLTVTQGSADAFKQENLTTGLTEGDETAAYRVKKLTVEWSSISGDHGDQVMFQVTRKSQAAMVSLSDKSCIIKRLESAIVTTSGAILQQFVREYSFVDFDVDEFLIVEPTLYVAIDSTATGTLTAYFDFLIEKVSISANDRLNLLYSALQ